MFKCQYYWFPFCKPFKQNNYHISKLHQMWPQIPLLLRNHLTCYEIGLSKFRLLKRPHTFYRALVLPWGRLREARDISVKAEGWACLAKWREGEGSRTFHEEGSKWDSLEVKEDTILPGNCKCLDQRAGKERGEKEEEKPVPDASLPGSLEGPRKGSREGQPWPDLHYGMINHSGRS